MTLAVAITLAVLGSSALTALVNAWLGRHKTKADTRQVVIDTDRAWIETIDKVRDFVLEEVVRLQEALKAAREESCALRQDTMRLRMEIQELTLKLEEAESRAQKLELDNGRRQA